MYMESVTGYTLTTFRRVSALRRELTETPTSELESMRECRVVSGPASWPSSWTQEALETPWDGPVDMFSSLWRLVSRLFGVWQTQDDRPSPAQQQVQKRVAAFSSILNGFSNITGDGLAMAQQHGPVLKRRLCIVSKMLRHAVKIGEIRMDRVLALGQQASSSSSVGVSELGDATHQLRHYGVIGSVLCCRNGLYRGTPRQTTTKKPSGRSESFCS
ncbi:hypothetical protein LY76DRAFT_597605 [Colletotrichum caudatum]|nr:hypothetical protein LY76DRAFT_597605 [Colletotrichum caudatum]